MPYKRPSKSYNRDSYVAPWSFLTKQLSYTCQSLQSSENDIED